MLEVKSQNTELLVIFSESRVWYLILNRAVSGAVVSYNHRLLSCVDSDETRDICQSHLRILNFCMVIILLLVFTKLLIGYFEVLTDMTLVAHSFTNSTQSYICSISDTRYSNLQQK